MSAVFTSPKKTIDLPKIEKDKKHRNNWGVQIISLATAFVQFYVFPCVLIFSSIWWLYNWLFYGILNIIYFVFFLLLNDMGNAPELYSCTSTVSKILQSFFNFQIKELQFFKKDKSIYVTWSLISWRMSEKIPGISDLGILRLCFLDERTILNSPKTSIKNPLLSWEQQS